MVERRDALYRIVAATDWKPGLENTAELGWASHDSLTFTKVRGTREGQAQEPGTVLQVGTDWPLPFKTRVRGGGLLEKNRTSKIKKKIVLYIPRQHLLSRAQDWQQGP